MRPKKCKHKWRVFGIVKNGFIKHGVRCKKCKEVLDIGIPKERAQEVVKQLKTLEKIK